MRLRQICALFLESELKEGTSVHCVRYSLAVQVIRYYGMVIAKLKSISVLTQSKHGAPVQLIGFAKGITSSISVYSVHRLNVRGG